MEIVVRRKFVGEEGGIMVGEGESLWDEKSGCFVGESVGRGIS